MKTVYDMSSGQVVTPDHATELPERLVSDAEILQLQLQPVVTDSRPERKIPPELALADLNAFFDKMS
ncbi:MAG: hypothetical protein KZQ93_07120 [Candidatus Thiodiazotropha sp. (ex Monitilora ramsayi)]|nr:hypothetical protein [Candidatus Thiodiazotropha sp. (ex Monitilora ramsayi)]